MNHDEVTALSNVDMRKKVARLLGATEIVWVHTLGLPMGYWPDEGWRRIENYPCDDAAAMGLAKAMALPFSIERSYRNEYEIGPMGWSCKYAEDEWDNPLEVWAETFPLAITCAFILAADGKVMEELQRLKKKLPGNYILKHTDAVGWRVDGYRGYAVTTYHNTEIEAVREALEKLGACDEH